MLCQTERRKGGGWRPWGDKKTGNVRKSSTSFERHDIEGGSEGVAKLKNLVRKTSHPDKLRKMKRENGEVTQRLQGRDLGYQIQYTL